MCTIDEMINNFFFILNNSSLSNIIEIKVDEPVFFKHFFFWNLLNVGFD